MRSYFAENKGATLQELLRHALSPQPQIGKLVFRKAETQTQPWPLWEGAFNVQSYSGLELLLAELSDSPWAQSCSPFGSVDDLIESKNVLAVHGLDGLRQLLPGLHQLYTYQVEVPTHLQCQLIHLRGKDSLYENCLVNKRSVRNFRYQKLRRNSRKNCYWSSTPSEKNSLLYSTPAT